MKQKLRSWPQRPRALLTLPLLALTVGCSASPVGEQPITQGNLTQGKEEQPRFSYCGEGNQTLVDVCYGVVRVTHYEEQGAPVTYAAHWNNGGKDFPLEPGSKLTISGVGEFEILGVKAELSFTGHKGSDMPHTQGVYFQTCLDNDRERMIFIEAKEITP